MALRVSGKNLDIGEALRAKIVERVEAATARYFDGRAIGHVTVERDGTGFRTDCALHLASGITLQAEGAAHDAYASANRAVEHIEKRLRRYKRRIKDHGAAATPPNEPPLSMAVAVLQAPDEDEEGPHEFQPIVIAESQANLTRMSVGQAVTDLDLTGAPVVVFRHAGSGRVNLVYRRGDGHIGWIDPPPVGADPSP